MPSLHVRVKIPRPGVDTMEPLWQVDLLTGALVELAGSHRALQSDIGTIDVSAQVPNGKVFPNLGGGMGGVARGQHFAGADDTDAEVRNYIERRASSLGLRVDSVTVFRALGAAPAVVLTAPHIRSTAANLGTVEERLFGEGSTPRYEGFFLEIRGTDGTPHVWRSVSYLTGVGSLSIDRAIGGCGASCG